MSSPAVILVDHGSRQPEADDAAARVARWAAQRLGLRVERAHLAHGRPTLEEALAGLEQAGVESVIIRPYFLTPGVHVRRDVAALAAAAAGRHPRLRVEVTAPLGPDPLLAELVARRVQARLGGREDV